MRLLRLKIENFAIIKQIDIEFKSGFTVMTGETGAGKSIIIEALNLALGDKASQTVIRSGEEFASVECVFQLDRKNPRLVAFFQSKKIDTERESLILRREISYTGRSKAWINGKSFPVSLLKEIGDRLVDLHGQHDHQSLLNEETHIDFLDSYGNYAELLTEVKSCWQHLRLVQDSLNILEQRRKINHEKRELWEFQIDEIQKVDPKSGEFEELTQTKTLLENAEKIHGIAEELTNALYENDASLYHRIVEVEKKLGNLCRLSPMFVNYLTKLEESQYLFQEISNQLTNFASGLQYDPLQLEKINQRLYSLQQLMRKYGPGLDDVMAYAEQVRKNLAEDDGSDIELARLTKEVKAATENYMASANRLSERRKEESIHLESKLDSALNRLGIKGSLFKVQIDPICEVIERTVSEPSNHFMGEKGIDHVVFHICTNPGEPLRPLADIVSGGEVSRIMLGLKSILAGRDQIPVLIFDEIDTGISGRIARIVGEELRELAKFHQIICITHLPQIAGLGLDHLSVQKITDNGRSATQIIRLSHGERIKEIATMIGGKSISQTTLRQAEELLS
ncbi:MAG: DNA repair protein RecN [Candidatus Marinimicrobia bacterium CG08_land_8_20_14_0_20_45_22]|nr:MAG: DNA repair protein RecN [Candidatus Marinimicrobia bacterium CG08_land_8_20_14_0_20_45_22]